MVSNRLNIFFVIFYILILASCSSDKVSNNTVEEKTDYELLLAKVDSNKLWCNYSEGLISQEYNINILMSAGPNQYYFKGTAAPDIAEGSTYELESTVGIFKLFNLQSGSYVEQLKNWCGSVSLGCFGVSSDIVQLSEAIVEFDSVLRSSWHQMTNVMIAFPEETLITLGRDGSLIRYIPCGTIKGFRVEDMNNLLTELIPM